MANSCRECGAQVRLGDKLCPNCGKKNPAEANVGDVWLVSYLGTIGFASQLSVIVLHALYGAIGAVAVTIALYIAVEALPSLFGSP
jgi:hypothetical protein